MKIYNKLADKIYDKFIDYLFNEYLIETKQKLSKKKYEIENIKSIINNQYKIEDCITNLLELEYEEKEIVINIWFLIASLITLNIVDKNDKKIILNCSIYYFEKMIHKYGYRHLLEKELNEAKKSFLNFHTTNKILENKYCIGTNSNGIAMVFKFSIKILKNIN